MCADEQNILMRRKEVDDVRADKGLVTTVTGSVHKGSTFNPPHFCFYKLLMNMPEMRNEMSLVRQT